MTTGRTELVTVDLGDGTKQEHRERLKGQVQTVLAREQDIAQLARDAAQLNTAFNEFGLVVEGQDKLINDVEVNIDETKEGAKEAAQELVIAEQHKRSWSRKRMYIIAIIVVALLVLALVIFLMVR